MKQRNETEGRVPLYQINRMKRRTRPRVPVYFMVNYIFEKVCIKSKIHFLRKIEKRFWIG